MPTTALDRVRQRWNGAPVSYGDVFPAPADVSYTSPPCQHFAREEPPKPSPRAQRWERAYLVSSLSLLAALIACVASEAHPVAIAAVAVAGLCTVITDSVTGRLLREEGR